MNDFNNGTDMLKTAAETAKRNIMNIKNTIYDIEPQIIKLFLEKINNSKVDIKQIGKLWLARSVKNQNVRKSFFDKEGLEELILKINNDLKDGKIIHCDGIFIAIGSIPNSELFQGNKENNYIKVNSRFETSIKDVYASGDVIKKELYQLITASSEGAKVANNIIKKLNGSDNHE